MKVKIKYFALIREYTKKKEDIFDINEGSSIKDLLLIIRTNYENLINIIFDDNGNLINGLILLVNGEYVNQKDFSDFILQDGDTAAIIPPVGGG